MWINNVAQIRKTKQPHSVAYSKPMPEIDDLMQVRIPVLFEKEENINNLNPHRSGHLRLKMLSDK